jgi:hypothetical protein
VDRPIVQKPAISHSYASAQNPCMGDLLAATVLEATDELRRLLVLLSAEPEPGHPDFRGPNEPLLIAGLTQLVSLGSLIAIDLGSRSPRLDDPVAAVRGWLHEAHLAHGFVHAALLERW